MYSALITRTAPASWSPTGSMISDRDQFNAHTLLDGTVLVIGGQGVHNTTTRSSCETWDPATGLWTATGSLNVARQLAASALLPNGTVVVLGGTGTSFSSLKTIEIYDPSTGSWTLLSATMTVERSFYPGCVLLPPTSLHPQGMVLVVGGFDAGLHRLQSTELFDPISQTCTASGSMGVARGSCVATLLSPTSGHVAGSVLITGGTVSDLRAEIYDIATGTFSFTGANIVLRGECRCALLPSGNILITGGGADGTGGHLADALASCEIYDVAAGTFNATDSMREGRFAHTSQALPDGRVLIAAGDGYIDSHGTLTLPLTVDIFDETTGLFAPAPSITQGKGDLVSVQLSDGRIMQMGGQIAGNIDLASAEIFTPTITTEVPYSRTAKMDVRDACALALSRVIQAIDVVIDGEHVRFNHVFDEWPADSEQFDPPAACVLAPPSWKYAESSMVPHLLEDTVEMGDAYGYGLYKSAEMLDEFTLQIRATTSAQRSLLKLAIEDAFQTPNVMQDPQGQRYGLLLDLPEYWGLQARASLLSGSNSDSDDAAMRNQREATFVISMQADKVQLGEVYPMALTVTKTMKAPDGSVTETGATTYS